MTRKIAINEPGTLPIDTFRVTTRPGGGFQIRDARYGVNTYYDVDTEELRGSGLDASHCGGCGAAIAAAAPRMLKTVFARGRSRQQVECAACYARVRQAWGLPVDVVGG